MRSSHCRFPWSDSYLHIGWNQFDSGPIPSGISTMSQLMYVNDHTDNVLRMPP